jgi:hypothetical protein
MGRNQGKRSIRNEQKHQGHEDRHDNRQTGNLGQHEGRVILGNIAGPGDQRAELSPTMMASVMVSASMKIKRADGGLFEFIEAGRANDPGH